MGEEIEGHTRIESFILFIKHGDLVRSRTNIYSVDKVDNNFAAVLDFKLGSCVL